MKTNSEIVVEVIEELARFERFFRQTYEERGFIGHMGYGLILKSKLDTALAIEKHRRKLCETRE